ncbi:MAG: hypothetical protein ACK46L_05005, partial [Synechococcaceae cyanobacterium]
MDHESSAFSPVDASDNDPPDHPGDLLWAWQGWLHGEPQRQPAIVAAVSEAVPPTVVLEIQPLGQPVVCLAGIELRRPKSGSHAAMDWSAIASALDRCRPRPG